MVMVYSVGSPYGLPSATYLVISVESILMRYTEHIVDMQSLLHVKLATLKGESGPKGPSQNTTREKRGHFMSENNALSLYFPGRFKFFWVDSNIFQADLNVMSLSRTREMAQLQPFQPVIKVLHFQLFVLKAADFDGGWPHGLSSSLLSA